MTLNLALRLGAVAAAGSGFSDPTSVSGLVFWFDASDASTFTYSSGVVVSQWNDKSGGGRNATQAATGSQPSRSGTINSLASVVFDGSNDFMTTGTYALAASHTTFVVARNTATGTQRTVWRSNSGGDSRTYRTTGGNIAFFDGTVVDTGNAWGTSSARLVAAIFDGGTPANSLYAIDSGSWTSMNPGNIANTTSAAGIGTDNPSASSGAWTGDVCEIVVYDGALSSTDRDNVRTYLKNKWGTA